MILFGAIFKVNRSFDKLWELLGHFDEKDKVDFNKYYFSIEQLYIVLHVFDNCVIFAKTM